LKGANRKFITDVNGYFIIDNIPVGKVTLLVNYIGYNSSEYTVNIEDGKTTNVDFKISGLNNDMKGITVNGIRRGEAVALSSMRNADNIKYVLSEEQIERFPDATVGEAMQRVPGVAMDYSYGRWYFRLCQYHF
ncbi:MAG: TonB-dependent receptor, partial [Pedobacter sp.]